jgi:hypothetical protein
MAEFMGLKIANGRQALDIMAAKLKERQKQLSLKKDNISDDEKKEGEEIAAALKNFRVNRNIKDCSMEIKRLMFKPQMSKLLQRKAERLKYADNKRPESKA